MTDHQLAKDLEPKPIYPGNPRNLMCIKVSIDAVRSICDDNACGSVDTMAQGSPKRGHTATQPANRGEQGAVLEQGIMHI